MAAGGGGGGGNPGGSRAHLPRRLTHPPLLALALGTIASTAALSPGGVFGSLMICSPSVVITWPAMGGLVVANSSSAYTRLEVAYTITFPCPAEASGGPPARRRSPRLEDCVLQLRERHSVNPGTMDLAPLESIFVVATEPGTYAFELSLVARNGRPGAPPLSATAVVFDFVRNYSAEALPTIPTAFDAGANVYRVGGDTIPGALPRAAPVDLPLHTVPPQPLPWTDGIPFFSPTAYSSGAAASPAGGAYWDRLPPHIAAAISPMHLGVVGGLGGMFDGTKQFLVQYETMAEPRLLAFTHLDMMSEPAVALASPAGAALTAANVTLLFERVVLQLSDFDSTDDFLQAGARMSRAAAWCHLSPRMQSALVPLSRRLAGFDALWRVNYDAGEEYLQQTARLALPGVMRLNDLVGRVDMPCRNLRATPPAGGGGRDATAILSGCPAAAAAANDFAPGWEPDIDLTPVAYLHEQYAREVAPVYRRVGRSVAAVQAAIQALDARYNASRDAMGAWLPGEARAARNVWQPQSYETLVAPSHFVAQLRSTRAMARPVVVIPGLNARRVALAPRDDRELTVVGPSREAAEARAAACAGAWGGWVPSTATPEPPPPPVTVAFIGRVVREKGVGLYISAVASLLARNASIAAAVRTGRLRFIAVGGAPAERYVTLLQRAAAATGAASAIHFVGFQPPTVLRAWYHHRCLDAVVAPYVRPLSESFGLVLVEAMEAEVPVVHFGVGGIQDYARSGSNSIVAECASGACLADALAPLLASPAYRRALGTTAAAHARAAFRSGDVADLMAARLRRAGAAAVLLAGATSGTFRELVATASATPEAACAGTGGERVVPPMVWADAVARVQRRAAAAVAASAASAGGSWTCGAGVPAPAASGSSGDDDLVSAPSVHAALAGGAVRAVPLVSAHFTANGTVQVQLALRLGVQPAEARSDRDGELAVGVSRKFADVMCGFAEPGALTQPLPVSCACPSSRVLASLATLAYEQAHTVGVVCVAAGVAGSAAVEERCTHVMDLLPVRPPGAQPRLAADGTLPILPTPLVLPDTALPRSMMAPGGARATHATVSLIDHRMPFTVLAAVDCHRQS